MIYKTLSDTILLWGHMGLFYPIPVLFSEMWNVKLFGYRQTETMLAFFEGPNAYFEVFLISQIPFVVP